MSDFPVFTRIESSVRTLGGTIIAWEIHPLFKSPAPWTFVVLASPTGVGDWVPVASVVDDYITVDPGRWLYGLAPALHYKVVLTDGDGTVSESSVHQIVANFSQHDARILRDVVRKEMLRHTKFSGQHGYLFKRRRWGTSCPVCLDFDTHEVKNAHCPTCYGTGFIDGYFDPVHYWVSPSSTGVQRRTQTEPEGQGVVEPRTRPVRGLNRPWLDTGDVWVEMGTDQRFVVQSAKEVTFRDFAVIFDPIELRLAPATDIVYTLPLPDGGSSSSSSVPGSSDTGMPLYPNKDAINYTLKTVRDHTELWVQAVNGLVRVTTWPTVSSRGCGCK